ncbi:MAG: serine/threonine protein kinase, partial [Candidatus Krumholzibacteriia bacterium]
MDFGQSLAESRIESEFMSDPTWDDIETIFHKALAQDGTARDAYLQSVAPNVRQEVESLLEASENGGPLDQLQDDFIGATISVPPSESLVGSQICQYKIGALLGGGGMGAVYQAKDQRLGRTVALKFLLPHLTDKATAKQRFVLEAQAAARLEHPNICTILEVGESPDGKMFIAMPLYEGDSLRSRLNGGPIPLPELTDYARQICSGLNKAHEQGIVHRDIKPENIFVTDDGVLKILDFGIAKLSAAGVTGTGAVIGTLSYMSPEQASSQAVDHRSDIWSLGVMLFEMACGQAPFKRDNALAMINALVNQTPPTLDTIWPEAPPALTKVIQHALQKRPADRFQSVAELGATLDDLYDTEADTIGVTPNKTAILPEGERRLATVLVTHLHNYDTMIESVSPAEFELIQEQMHQVVRQCVALHGGVVNHASGAEVISLFGVPTTYEDDVVRAVRAARAIAEATQGHSALQSGIDSGYVIVQSSTNDDERYRIVGGALHTATRIAEDAGSSEILVTQACLRSLSPFFTVEQGADVRLKGGKSCAQYLVVAETDGTTRLEATESHRLTQYAGRSTEFEILTKRY